MEKDFLLKTSGAARLYFEYAMGCPIIDFHNHISIADVVSDRRFENIYELWIRTDPYKHRLMRICGVDEYFITGGASPYEKFQKYCEIFPLLAGTPVYDWSRMELSQVFGIDQIPDSSGARYLYDKCTEMLSSSEFSNNALLSRFNIEYQSPVVTLLDDLAPFGVEGIAPSLRGDDLLAPTDALIGNLSQRTGKAINDTASYIDAVSVMLDRFSENGCRFADHALDAGFFENDKDGSKTKILALLGTEYARRGWTLLLHLGAKRDTSPRLRRLAGPAGGYAAADSISPAVICDLFGAMERGGGLPATVLFPLNMNDQAPLAVIEGSFSEDGVAAKVQLGPAWWWCDHARGIENTLDSVASFGVLSQFIGMTTDSRSILSFVRHDYFRRLLCSYLDRRNVEGEWNMTLKTQTEIIEKICYKNAKKRIGGVIK